MALVCAGFWYGGFFALSPASLRFFWIAVGALWVLGGCALLRIGVAGWPRVPQAARLAGGWAVLLVAWLAMGQARYAGVAFLLSIMALVWAADVFAYFFGKALGGKLFGGRKLAPAISPGKSWEGALGGMIGVLVLAFSWMALERAGHVGGTSFYTALYELRGPVVCVLGLVFLTAMSVVGDLSESLVKRSAGVKDSSQLLPGHGGVLDRIDALLPTLPLAWMLVQM
jgi:phosphatidate cytidylyltransferase